MQNTPFESPQIRRSQNSWEFMLMIWWWELARLLGKYSKAIWGNISMSQISVTCIYMSASTSNGIENKDSFTFPSHYALKILNLFGMESCNAVSTSMLEYHARKQIESPLLNDACKKQYQRLIGCLLYLMHATRPDIAFVTIRLSQQSSTPMTHHWKDLKRVLSYIGGTVHARLILGERSNEHLIGYFHSIYIPDWHALAVNFLEYLRLALILAFVNDEERLEKVFVAPNI